jgi:TolA-binding protein
MLASAADAPAEAPPDTTAAPPDTVATAGAEAPAAAADTLGGQADSLAIVSPPSGTLVPNEGLRVPLSTDSLDVNQVRLGRAALEQHLGNLRGVVENLEPVDFTASSDTWEIDRAAFLLAQAYLELGSLDRFEQLAERVSLWTRQTPYTRWLAHQLATARSGGAVLTPEGETVLRSWIDGVPGSDAELLTRYAEAASRFATGGDGEAVLREVAGSSSPTALGRTLAGAALVQLATRRAAAGGDPRELLAAVPADNPYAGRARHWLGVATLERGEVEAGSEILRALLASDTSYAGRRAVRLALAAPALDAGRWTEAYEEYRHAEAEWVERRSELDSLLAAGRYDGLWAAWNSGLHLLDAVVLDAKPARSLAEQLADQSANLTATPVLDLPPLAGAARAGGSARYAPAPPPEARDSLAASARGLGELLHELERTRWAETREAERLAEERRYLLYGLRLAREERDRLAAHAARSDSIRRALEAMLARLASDHDATRRWVAQRTASILEQCERQILWLGAMRHFYVEGPQREQLDQVPLSVPTPKEIVTQELALAEAVRAFAERLRSQAPGLLAGIRDRARGAGLSARALALERELRRLADAYAALAAQLEAAVAGLDESPEARRLAERAASLERSADSLAAAHRALEHRLAEEAVRRAVADLETEREAIDYGLAAAAYGQSVVLARADSAAGGPSDSSQAALWRGWAIQHAEAFLARHTGSGARGETRFRLADLLLTDARQRFRLAMGRFVEAQEQGLGHTVSLPLLDYERSIALYDAILAEDTSFTHRDAVLMNAGSTLADDADPRAERYLQDLVARHPESPFCQEAYLRMGDLHFLERRFVECIPLFERAVAGPDTGLRLIALYKKGWAEFNQDRFLAAADDFRIILDVYEAGRGKPFAVDVESEAEAYLIHSLARAGGAAAFAEYFDRIGERPYERELILALGQHFRRYSLFGEAAAADQLHIARYPNHADALLSAQRMTDTFRRAEEPDSALAAQRRYAALFAPDGAWARAQSSDSVRAEGVAFARNCWTAVALHHHEEAARTGSRADWQEALQVYRTLLRHWPDDPNAPAFALHAGEASAELGDYAGALSHYAAAAASGRDSIPELALRQRVAVIDAWYEKSRAAAGAAPGGKGTGSDSLARIVLANGDDLLERYPAHSDADDILWRQGNLAFAHGWYDRAASDFQRLRAAYPNDPRTPVGASLRADALFRLDRFEEAGAAFESTLVSARQAGRDSLVKIAEAAIPVCYFRQAEAAVAADSTDYARHAALFERVATQWPDYEHSEVALYRAGVSWIRAGKTSEGVRAMERLIQRSPDGEYAKDAHLHIAEAWKASGDRERAAAAYADFADRYPADPSADEAVLQAADLYKESGNAAASDSLRLSYLRRFPDDVATAMEILEDFARRDLATVTPERPISKLLAAGTSSRLGEYLKRAEKHPDLASPALVAQVRFLQAEESRAAYEAVRLTQPLKTSIAARQKQLDATLGRYRACAELGVTEWSHASAFRIGQALASFGTALEKSERPRDLTGDDLVAYEDVLFRESQVFYDRAEEVWIELLSQADKGAEHDEWMKQARSALYERLATRFLYRAEVEYPLILGEKPAGGAPPKRDGKPAAAAPSAKPGEAPAYAKGDGKE